MQSPSRQYQPHVTPFRKLPSPTCLGPSFLRSSPYQAVRYEDLDEDMMAGELLELMNLASAAIQACWRGYCTRKQLVIEQGAATLLQAFWRGYCVRRDLRVQIARSLEDVKPADPTQGAKTFSLELQPRDPGKQLAASDQNHCKRCWARDRLAEWKRGRLKGKLPGLDCGRAVDQRVAAAIVVQSYWRGFVARRHMALQHIAATVIQSHYRAHLTRLWIRAHLHPSSTSRDADPPACATCPVSEPRTLELCSPGNSVTELGPQPPAAQHRPKGPFFPARLSEVPRPQNPIVKRPFSNAQRTGEHPAGGHFQFRGESFISEEPDTATTTCPPEGGSHHSLTSTNGQAREKTTDDKPRDNTYWGSQAELKSIRVFKGTGDEDLESLQKQPCQETKELEHGYNKYEPHECPSPNRPRFTLMTDRPASATRPVMPELPYRARSQVSEYMLFSSPNHPNSSRKLIRFSESPCFGFSEAGQNQDPESALSEPDFDLSDLEIPREATSYPSKPSLRKSIQRAREENVAARVIQAIWRGYRARKLLRQQISAAVKIQAMYRSYRTRKEFQNFGIYRLFSELNRKDFKEVEVWKDGPSLGVFSCEPPPGRQLPYQHLPGGGIAPGHEGPLPRVRELPIAVQKVSLPGRALEGALVTSCFLPQTGNTGLTPTGRNQTPASQEKHLEALQLAAVDNWPRKRSLQTRRQHQEKERAALVIQAAWRGHKDRTAITRQERAATKIQIQIRKFLTGLERELKESPGTAKAVSWENTPRLSLRGNPKNQCMKQHSARGISPVGQVPSQVRSKRCTWKTKATENEARYNQVKSIGCGIFVKRNPCYNPRKVTIHVKAATGDIS